MIKKNIRKIFAKLNSYKEEKNHNEFIKKNSELVDANNIETHMTSQEKRILYELSKSLKEKSKVVEIGSYIGASSCFIADALLTNDSTLYCIDTWDNDAMTEGKKDTYITFKENTREFKNNIVMVRGMSGDVVGEIERLTENHVDLLFIDGDHSFEGVKLDWDKYSPMLKSGSIVIFHDYGWATGVQKVVDELALPLTVKTKKLSNMFWGVIK